MTAAEVHRRELETPRRSLALPVVLVLAAAAVAFAERPLTAQQPAPAGRRAASTQGEATPGKWFGIAVGGAGIRLTCDLCDPTRELGPAVELSVGSYAHPDLRVGIEVGGWTHDDDGSRESVYRAGVVAHLRPRPESSIYLMGGFGWTRYSAGVFRYDAPRVSLGAGWERPFGDNMRIGNQLTLDASSFGSLKNGQQAVARMVGMSLVRLSIQLYGM